jgi:hypothetical protein
LFPGCDETRRASGTDDRTKFPGSPAISSPLVRGDRRHDHARVDRFADPIRAIRRRCGAILVDYYEKMNAG